MSIGIYKRKTDKIYSITITDYWSISAGKTYAMIYLKPKIVKELRNELNKLRLK